MSLEKTDDAIAPAAAGPTFPTHNSDSSLNDVKLEYENEGEIFKRGEGIEDFRTVSWIHTSMILLKRKIFPLPPPPSWVVHFSMG